MSMGILACLSVFNLLLAMEIQTLESKLMQLGSQKVGVLASIKVRYTFIHEIKAKQFELENMEDLGNKNVMRKA